jgi:hypothetical protein
MVFPECKITLRVLLEFLDRSTPPHPYFVNMFGRGHCKLSDLISRQIKEHLHGNEPLMSNTSADLVYTVQALVITLSQKWTEKFV